MPTNQKTSLGFNNWDGQDKPARTDFTGDNILLDTLLTKHFADTTLHLTEEMHKKIEEPIVFGFYYGNNKSEQAITLSFEPKLVLIFASLLPVIAPQGDASGFKMNLAVAMQGEASSGAELDGSTLYVYQESAKENPTGITANLNAGAQYYCYAAFR